MPTIDAIRWFKTEFGKKIDKAVQGTPFSPDLLVAIACQETGYLWNTLRKKMPTTQVLALCVGDVIDAPRRTAFPTNKADLLKHPQGAAMFALGRQALLDMAAHIASYQPSAKIPTKFCRGYGVFQYDLQFLKTDPDYFLLQRYKDFDASLGKALQELRAKLIKLGWQNKTQLSDYESMAVAIAYNTGRFNPAKGPQQGYQSADGRYYGEAIADFLRLSQQVQAGSADAASPALPPAPPVLAEGAAYVVSSLASVLNVRSAPLIPEGKPNANIVATLPEGHAVRAVTDKKRNGFLEIETSLNGAFVRGFCKASYLKAATAALELPELQPATEAPASGVTAVYMPRKAGTVTRRADKAGAHSLNEKDMPQRAGQTPTERKQQLAAVITWLDSENPQHLRYWPRDQQTFCNIYAHDYCFLAGCYLPRVWWNAPAIVALSAGKTVEPLYGKTIDEVRANDLFRWLRDFGLQFGWRQTTSLQELQDEANLGAVGLIVARRKEEGRSGHIVAVVAETAAVPAKRRADGTLVSPVQSQAGATNFQRGTGKADWYKGAEFAEFAFWLHA